MLFFGYSKANKYDFLFFCSRKSITINFDFPPMKELESINNHNEYIREMQSELETLTLKGPHAGSSYNHAISFRIGHLRAQIHAVTLKRNHEITKVYSQFAKNL
jgi:hypothetical protein